MPLVLRFSSPSWSLVLPVVLAVVGVLIAGIVMHTRRSASRPATLLWGLGAAVAIGAAVVSFRRAVVPGPVVIHGFGIFFCVALLTAWGVAKSRVRVALDHTRLPAVFVACVAGALIGARLLFVATTADGSRWLELLAFHHGGLALWGGIAGGLAALLLHCRATSQSMSAWSIVLAPAALTAIAIGRIGCFASGSHFGRELPTDAWGVLRGLGTYPRWSQDAMALAAGPPAWLAQVERQHLPISRLLSNPTHPVQLYETLLLGLLLALFFRSKERWRQHPEMPRVLLFAYAALAFALEWLRDDAERGFIGPGIKVGAAMLLGALALGVSLWFGARRLGVSSGRSLGWCAYFVVPYGLWLWGIAGELAQLQVHSVRWSVAQCAAVLAVLGAAFTAGGFAKGAQNVLPAQSSPGS